MLNESSNLFTKDMFYKYLLQEEFTEEVSLNIHKYTRSKMITRRRENLKYHHNTLQGRLLHNLFRQSVNAKYTFLRKPK